VVGSPAELHRRTAQKETKPTNSPKEDRVTELFPWNSPSTESSALASLTEYPSPLSLFPSFASVETAGIRLQRVDAPLSLPVQWFLLPPETIPITCREGQAASAADLSFTQRCSSWPRFSVTHLSLTPRFSGVQADAVTRNRFSGLGALALAPHPSIHQSIIHD